MTRRAGFSLIELLVVLAIVGLLLGLLIPAVQSARESARRNLCQNNLRQVSAAILHFEAQRGELPRLYNGTFLTRPATALDEFHFHSWRVPILPQLEQAAVYNAMNLGAPVTTPSNRTGFATRLSVFVCPSTSNYNEDVPGLLEWNGGQPPVRQVGTGARSDYEVIAGVRVAPQTGSSADLSIIRFGPWGEPSYDVATGLTTRYRPARLSDIRDGTSNTVLVAERAGRPDIFRKGEPDRPYPYDPTTGPDHHQAAWAVSTHIWWIVSQPDVPVNQTNTTGFYSFHPGGAQAAMADGSVRFLKDSTGRPTLKALVTRAGSDIVGE